ncbi:MAG: FAD-dependent oxidoreductase, partial [Acidimicrobiales bacterium]
EWNCSLRNYMADPQEWVNLFKVAGNDRSGQWRAVFPTQVEDDDEQALSDEALRRRLGRLAKENLAEQLLHRKLYNVHQRVAASFRQGRVFLAGDAAHVNNPSGGLGLNCGIHDAMELVDTLHAAGSGDDPLLDRYEARRRAINIEFVQGQTVANKQRLEEKDPAQRRKVTQLRCGPRGSRPAGLAHGRLPAPNRPQRPLRTPGGRKRPVTIDLKADLHNEDDAGRNWALLSGATDPWAVRPGAVLRAGTKRFWSWVRIDDIDADAQVHFHQISGAEAYRSGQVSATS